MRWSIPAPRILVFLMVLAIGWIVAKVLDQTAPEPTHPTGYLQDSGSTEDYPRETDEGDWRDADANYR